MSSTASSRSRTRSVGTSYRNGLDSATSSHTSTSSRRECSCSSSNIHQRQSSVNRQSSKQSHSHSNSAKSIEQIHLNKLQSLINGDTKKIKKAPWKQIQFFQSVQLTKTSVPQFFFCTAIFFIIYLFDMCIQFLCTQFLTLAVILIVSIFY